MDTSPRTEPYPAPTYNDQPRRSPGRRVALGVVAGAAALAGVAGLGYFSLAYAFNPMADEWICSQGEVPTDAGCYPEDATLPQGVKADPYGNRPMPYNCNKSGWLQVGRPAPDGSVQGDCVKEGTDIPDTWYVFD